MNSARSSQNLKYLRLALHIDSDTYKNYASIFKSGSNIKCSNALGFTMLTHSYFRAGFNTQYEKSNWKKFEI